MSIEKSEGEKSFPRRVLERLALASTLTAQTAASLDAVRAATEATLAGQVETKEQQTVDVPIEYADGPHVPFKIETNLGRNDERTVDTSGGLPRSVQLRTGRQTIDVLVTQGRLTTYRVKQGEKVGFSQENPIEIDVKGDVKPTLIIDQPLGLKPWPERNNEPEEEPGKKCSVVCTIEGTHHLPFQISIDGKPVAVAHDGKALQLPELEPGDHTVTVIPTRQHYPQPYRLEISHKDWVHKSTRRVAENTPAPLKAGQTLNIVVPEAIETYDKTFFRFRDVDCCLTLINAYPHWRIGEDVHPGPWPNPLLAIQKYGIEGAAKAQAKFVTDKLYDPREAQENDFRSPLEIGLVTALAQDGSVDPRLRGCTLEELKKLSAEELARRKAALETELTEIFIDRIQYVLRKCWRTSNLVETRPDARYDASGAPIGVLPGANHYFGEEIEVKRMHLTKEQALRRWGARYLTLWEKELERRKEK